MLEAGEVLQTYRLDVPPGRLAEKGCAATRIQDHPLRFLTYQGSVNEGLGSVRLADSGTYSVIEETAKSLRLQLNGEVLRGAFCLVQTDDTWRFGRCENDAGS